MLRNALLKVLKGIFKWLVLCKWSEDWCKDKIIYGFREVVDGCVCYCVIDVFDGL